VPPLINIADLRLVAKRHLPRASFHDGWVDVFAYHGHVDAEKNLLYADVGVDAVDRYPVRLEAL
jgi:hypothetical protein